MTGLNIEARLASPPPTWRAGLLYASFPKALAPPHGALRALRSRLGFLGQAGGRARGRWPGAEIGLGMKRKKDPLNFADAAQAAPQLPPLDAEEAKTLVMPAVPQPAPSSTTAPIRQEPDRDMSVATVEPPAYPAVRPAEAPRDTRLYWIAALASALWAGGMVGVALAYQNRMGLFNFDPFAIGVFALLALAPLGLIWLGLHTARQGAAFVAEARRSQDYAERMMQPAALAAAEAGSVMESMRRQIEQATAAALQAREDLGQLRDLLAEDTDRLIAGIGISTSTARALIESLSEERTELAALSGSLEVQAQGVAEAITRQARMVADASDLAQTQIAEAEAALAARAADLAAAAGEAGSAARVAGEDLARQTARLEAAGAAVADQAQVVEETLGQQRASLVAAAHDMRADQEDLAVQIETQRAQLADILAQSGVNAARLGEVAAQGADTIRQLAGEAADQFREVGETAQAERDLLGATALQSLGAFSEAAAFERRALEEQTRRAIEALQEAAEEVHRNAEISGESARQKVEQLSEAAFAAGQKADAVFDARLAEARELIERTAALVEEAGQRSVQRIDNSVLDARDALAQLESGLASIEARTAQLPQEAQARAAEIKAALQTATDSLLATARQAADETQAIDAAFQERVKRNYEMLSEAVRLMGVIGGSANARASGGGARPPPPRQAGETALLRPAPPPADLAERPRLRLTPAAVEDAESAMFEPPATPVATPTGPSAASPTPSAAPVDPDAWSWSDLLGAVDDGGAVDEGSLADLLSREIEALGLDSAGLLPRARIDEVIRALDEGNPAAGRESVRRLAPAAIRRLSRRVLSDKVLRSQSDRFIQSYKALLKEAGLPGAETSRLALLGSDAGRTFLLLDAAVGDLN